VEAVAKVEKLKSSNGKITDDAIEFTVGGIHKKTNFSKS